MIEIKNISFRYENAEGGSLNDVSLTVGDGECVLLCGESGCGKTTVTRLINGLIPHYYEGELTGQVLLSGFDVTNAELYETARSVGSVFQNPRSQFFCVDTTSEIAFGCENMGLPEDTVRERIWQAAEELQMTELLGRNIFELSGGEKQKVACASVSAIHPQVFVLDEPTSNLDMDAIQNLKKTLRLWKSQGRTIVIAEHRLHWLTDLCDRVIYMKDGRIGFDIPMRELCHYSEEKITALGLRALSLSALPAAAAANSARTADSAGTANSNSAGGANSAGVVNSVGAINSAGTTDSDGYRAGSALELKNYKFSYGKKEALTIPGLSLPEGGVIAVIGHNGAGKSTFARCLCGLEKHFGGKACLDGEEFGRRKMLKKSYLVMQDVNHQLFCESVEEEVRLGMEENEPQNSKKDTQNDSVNDVESVLKALDLDGLCARHPMSLSGGQKQRVAVASAILAGKEVLLFDEPTSGLDFRHMEQTAALLRSLCGKKTVFIITHDPELIVRCCTHILHLENGRAVEQYPLNPDTWQTLIKFYDHGLMAGKSGGQNMLKMTECSEAVCYAEVSKELQRSPRLLLECEARK